MQLQGLPAGILNYFYLTHRLHFSVCVYCITDDATACKEQKVRDETKSSGVTVVLYTLWRLLWSITVHTHARKNNLFVLYNKNSNGLSKVLGGMKKEKQGRWRDLASPGLQIHIFSWQDICLTNLQFWSDIKLLSLQLVGQNFSLHFF